MRAPALLVLLALLAAACQQDGRRVEPLSVSAPGTEADTGRRGVALERPIEDFTLTDDRGEPFRLSNLRGRTVLLTFGYTHCPDACPMTLSAFRSVKERLGERARESAFVFVSLDGARDTPEVLHRYVKHFDPEFIGLTGPKAALDAIAPTFGLYYEIRRPSDGSENYTVDHTVSTYLIDQQGRLRYVYPFQTPPEEIAGDTLALLGEGPRGS